MLAVLFWDSVLLCSQGFPRTHKLSASASGGIGSQARATDLCSVSFNLSLRMWSHHTGWIGLGQFVQTTQSSVSQPQVTSLQEVPQLPCVSHHCGLRVGPGNFWNVQFRCKSLRHAWPCLTGNGMSVPRNPLSPNPRPSPSTFQYAGYTRCVVKAYHPGQPVAVTEFRGLLSSPPPSLCLSSHQRLSSLQGLLSDGSLGFSEALNPAVASLTGPAPDCTACPSHTE